MTTTNQQLLIIWLIIQRNELPVLTQPSTGPDFFMGTLFSNILMYFFPQSSYCPIVYAYETLPLTFTEERRLTQTFHGIECSDFCLLDCDLENYYILMLIYTVM